MKSSLHIPDHIKTCGHPFFFLLAWWLFSCLYCPASGINISCVDKEREALLQFKGAIQFDVCGLLTSWGDDQPGLDCCQWAGVGCSNRTGHVVRLDLGQGYNYQRRCLIGKISASLIELKHLEYLDLSFNNFQGQPIPSFIGSLTNLRHLNLSNSEFGGEIPHHLANLSHLITLDLNIKRGRPYFPTFRSLGWLSHLTLLRYINLSGIIDLSETGDWFRIVTNLPFLRVLLMDWCNLISPTIPYSSLSYINSSTTLAVVSLDSNYFMDASIFQVLYNFSRIGIHFLHISLAYNNFSGLIPNNFEGMHSLSYLDLSWNRFHGQIPDTFGSLHSLSYLDLSGNQLQGTIPEVISNIKLLGNLCNLQTLKLQDYSLMGELSVIIQTLSAGCAHKSLVSLDLGGTQIWGNIPDSISMFSSLRELSLPCNHLNGTISPNMGQLPMLERLNLNNNSLKGTLSHRHFSNLSRLRAFAVSNNPALVFNISTVNWVPPFQLDILNLGFCNLGPHFPKWLLTQTNISELDMSNAGISDSIPSSFWNSLSSNLIYLNFSGNMIHGMLPNLMTNVFYNFPMIDLSSNRLEGTVPSFPQNVSVLFLNNNMFSSSISLLCPRTKVALSLLDLSNNLLSGELPDCWMNFDQLAILCLQSNNFTGIIPTSIGALKGLLVLQLRNNSFHGELPVSLENCHLIVLDLSYNSFTGNLPPRIGNILKDVIVLDLRNNFFSGHLPLSFCQLSYLQMFDLSVNHISGAIPECIYNLSSMTNNDRQPFLLAMYRPVNGTFMLYSSTIKVMWKGKEQSFRNNLGLVKSIGISDNELQGQIPNGISSLTGLVSLDLGRNKLTGSIPRRLDELTSLELLDLSNNHLCGEIPVTLASLSSLEVLDLSNNNLTGKIPSGTQLQGFDPSTYMGNPALCGPPLSKCPGDQPSIDSTPKGEINITHHVAENDKGTTILPGFYISMVLGFIVGFWGVCGTLVLKTSWRHAYFRFLYHLKDTLHAILAVHIAAKLWRRP